LADDCFGNFFVYIDHCHFDNDFVEIVVVDDVVVVVVEDKDDHWKRKVVEQVNHSHHIDFHHFHLLFALNAYSMNVDKYD
jgi:hypothetical protein